LSEDSDLQETPGLATATMLAVKMQLQFIADTAMFEISFA
jgi:hypothetical protein